MEQDAHLVDAVRTWWTTELPPETALLADPEAFYLAKAKEIKRRRSQLVSEGQAPDEAFEAALWELLPSRIDLKDEHATPQVSEARAGDFVAGALAFNVGEKAEREARTQMTLPTVVADRATDATSDEVRFGFDPLAVVLGAASSASQYAQALKPDVLTESRSLRFPVALALAAAQYDTLMTTVREEVALKAAPGSFVGAGPVDLVVGRTSNGLTAEQLVGIELKAGDGRLEAVAWDVAKLAALLGDGRLHAAVLIVAAPTAIFDEAPAAGALLVPEPGDFTTIESESLARSRSQGGFAEDFASWASRGRQYPASLPSTLTLSGLAQASVSWSTHDGTHKQWAIRAVELTVGGEQFAWPEALRGTPTDRVAP